VRAPLLVSSVFVALSLAPLVACSETPSSGFEKFFAATVDGSPEAYDRLTARAQAEVARAAATRGEDPARALVQSTPKTTLRKVAVLEESGHTAVLEVTDALGKSEKVSMKKEAGLWKVDMGEAP